MKGRMWGAAGVAGEDAAVLASCCSAATTATRSMIRPGRLHSAPGTGTMTSSTRNDAVDKNGYGSYCNWQDVQVLAYAPRSSRKHLQVQLLLLRLRRRWSYHVLWLHTCARRCKVSRKAS